MPFIFTVLSCDTNGFEVKVGLGIGFEEVLTQLHVPAPEAEEYRPAEWRLDKLDFVFKSDLIFS